MRKAAGIIREDKAKILDQWEEAVNSEIQASKATTTLVLRNILPRILDSLGDILEQQEGKEDLTASENYEDVIKESIGHGRHRATSEHYTSKRIIREYIVLHRVLINILEKRKAYSVNVGVVVSFTMETSLAYSIDSFSHSLHDMRVKLTGTLAHDIRNPLSAAFLGIDVIKYKDGEERFIKIKDMVRKNLRRSLDLLEGLMDAITVNSGEGISLTFTESNVVEDVKLVCWEASESFHNPIRLDCEKENISGVFDATAIRRLLENLMTNAVKYGSRDSPITVSLKEQNDEVFLKVHNHGSFISPEQRENIFEFLNREHDNAKEGLKSWGIGLTFVKMAAEAHGGRVELQSDEQKQETSFTVTLHKNANSPGKKRVKLNYAV